MRSKEDNLETSSALDDPLAGEPEVWEFWETGLVVGSIAVGAAALIVLGWAVEQFILP
ncbi:MAG TPA: hypothetical protein VIM81_16460 [Gammaproteobacteria bacterium]